MLVEVEVLAMFLKDLVLLVVLAVVVLVLVMIETHQMVKMAKVAGGVLIVTTTLQEEVAQV